MDSIVFLRIEIIVFLISLTYLIYYLYEKFNSAFTVVRGALGSKNYSKEELETRKVSVATEKNHHVTTYKKVDLSIENKQKISETLKKVRLNISKGEYDLAKNYIIEGLVIDKFNKDLNLELAGIYIHENDYLKAEYIYKDLLLVHNDDFTVLKKLGYILSMQEKFELAIEIYKKAYSIDNKDYDLVNMLSHLTYFLKDYNSAIKYLKKFIKENPRDVDNLLLLGYSYKNVGDFAESINIFNRILDIQPYNEEVKEQLEIINEVKNQKPL